MEQPANEFLVVLVTAPSADKAAGIARALVEERLAACANIVPGMRSIYRWEGKVCDEAEALMVIKTRAEALEPLKQRVLALHPYSCPEVIALPVAGGHRAYLDWLAGQVGPVTSS